MEREQVAEGGAEMTDAPPFISNEDPAIDGAVMLASFDQSVA